MNRLIVFLAFCIVSSYAQGKNNWTFTIQNSVEVTPILDLGGQSPYEYWFLNSSFGTPISSDILQPELRRMGYHPTNSTWDVPINCMLLKIIDVVKEPMYVLIDTGLGVNISRGQSQLMKTLAEMDVDPSDIDYIVLSHGHGDHSGGLMNNDGTPAFPNATLIMGLDDWNYWHQPSPNWYDFCCPALLTSIQPWVYSALSLYEDRLILLDRHNASIFFHIPFVQFQIAAGHTSSGDLITYVNDALIVYGDSMVSGAFMENLGWGCGHDHHRVEGMKTRYNLVDDLNDELPLVLFAMHFAWPGFGTWNGTNFVYGNPFYN